MKIEGFLRASPGGGGGEPVEMPRPSGFVFFRTEETPEPCQGLPDGVRSLVSPTPQYARAVAAAWLAHPQLHPRGRRIKLLPRRRSLCTVRARSSTYCLCAQRAVMMQH
ncbi:hypothetical protein GQ55_2G361500 [Panicum hallii var. hallii]|uniref:Uncharacterized protein n=1 Tax=Panicum hallii var. hallii TaxID=1504633 RepID=A0A2T7EW45_9POAL|nr:hypothetical protein GQ55_2G361500 [Panicum hallii var. hallii]